MSGAASQCEAAGGKRRLNPTAAGLKQPSVQILSSASHSLSINAVEGKGTKYSAMEVLRTFVRGWHGCSSICLSVLAHRGRCSVPILCALCKQCLDGNRKYLINEDLRMMWHTHTTQLSCRLQDSPIAGTFGPATWIVAQTDGTVQQLLIGQRQAVERREHGSQLSRLSCPHTHTHQRSPHFRPVTRQVG